MSRPVKLENGEEGALYINLIQPQKSKVYSWALHQIEISQAGAKFDSYGNPTTVTLCLSYVCSLGQQLFEYSRCGGILLEQVIDWNMVKQAFSSSFK